MMHSFQFDPNTILGVAPGASLREIRDAYHQKSLKYHPDKGGDEWAFRMVARSYEILTTARVVNRASNEVFRPPEATAPTQASPEPEPRPEATWTNGFGSGLEMPPINPTVIPDSTNFLKGWGGAARSHAGESPDQVARIVSAELLILRFELECSLDLFVRTAEDRNLSCTVHISWPLVELNDHAEMIPDASRTLKKIGEAFKARGVRKHSLHKRSNVEHGRFDGWLTYPTAVMASEALEAFREIIAKGGLELEKQVREMAIPRQWG